MANRQVLELEQSRITQLYERLDSVRRRTAEALKAEYAKGVSGGTHQARVEREVSAKEHARRLAQLNGVERGLCFGRIDDVLEETLYIGRVGLRNDDHETILVDWRAPAARPFYAATPSYPGTLVRRRHLRTRGRTVVGVDDEVFDLDRENVDGGFVGEAALLAALGRKRTGRMGDVVATIQTEQDRVIRSGLHGTLVVQGGPGTGKTVAALHRAAYLLYAYRETLERRGVLVVGPNTTFLRYISQVLPSLGETDVVLAGVGDLFPGVRATVDDEPFEAVIKGDLGMVLAVANAVADRQRVPEGDLEIHVDGMDLAVPHHLCVAARDRARRSGRPHNVARKLMVLDLLRALAIDETAKLDRPVDDDELAYIRKVLWHEPPVRAAIDALWPVVTPQELVRDLLGKEPGDPWTTGDVPLLDEAAELLGEEPRPEAKKDESAELFAREVLTVTGVEEVEAALLADLNATPGEEVTTAQRAERDRKWIYGHVIVDEAQELSAMAWRMIMRRIPTRSMTIVGDIGQTGSPAGATSWAEMLDQYVTWREERLTVNYRTPRDVMDAAAEVLKEFAPDQEPPISVRPAEEPPRVVPIAQTGLNDVLRAEIDAATRDLLVDGEGRLAIITSGERYAEVASLVPEAVTLDPLDSPVALMTVTTSKGLEFDGVIVLWPEELAGRDLYVAMTRATRRLVLIHEQELPPALAGLTK
ncbi:HelD family protein [Herbidospora sp. RD11066]